MNEIQIFKNEQFGSIRTVGDGGKVLFCGKDIAEALGYSNFRDALNRHCKGVVKHDTLTNGGMQSLSYITEGDVYRLIAHSKLPGAEKFESWVFDEVLPSIRKTGGYITGQEQMNDTELLAKALLVAQKQIEDRNQLIETMQAKALFADAVSASKTSILVGELAKILRQNGVDTGQKRLFKWMRNNGYLVKSGSEYNMPTQRSMELKLFEIKESIINNPDGSITINKTAKVTGKGQQYFINKFL